MKKLSSIIAIAAIALPLSAFTTYANAGSAYIGGSMGTHSMFSTGGTVMSHVDGGFVVGANATHSGSIVGATGNYTNTASATHHYGSSYADGGLSMSARNAHARVNFNGGMRTNSHGIGTSNVAAGVNALAVAGRSGHSTSAYASMGTGGTAMSLGNVQSYTSSGGVVSAFAWH